VVLLFELASGLGKELVVAFSFSLFLRLSFLLFSYVLFGGVFVCKEGHVVQSGGVCGNFWSQERA
jgi:hypothetical protein